MSDLSKNEQSFGKLLQDIKQKEKNNPKKLSNRDNSSVKDKGKEESRK